MDEFFCQKCKALLGIFPDELQVKCTCGMEYKIDWSEHGAKARPVNAEKKEAVVPSLSESDEILIDKVTEDFYKEVNLYETSYQYGFPFGNYC